MIMLSSGVAIGPVAETEQADAVVIGKSAEIVETDESALDLAWGIGTHFKNWVIFRNQNSFHVNPHFDATITLPEESIVVYCVHGTADYPNAYQSLVKHGIAYLPSKILGIRLVAFERRFSGKTMDQFIEELQEMILSEGHKNIVLVGHSRGALIVSKLGELFFHQRNEEKQLNFPIVKAIIPICGPFHGSMVARNLNFLSPSVSEMAPGSDFLENLLELIQTTKIHYYPISVDNDEYVSKDSASLSEITNPHVKPARHFLMHTHISIMASTVFSQQFGGILYEIAEQVLPISLDWQEMKVLSPIFDKIDEQITHLQSNQYLKSPIAKIQILTKLKIILEKARLENSTNSIGEVIESFLYNKQITHSLSLGEYTPLEILRVNLNGPSFKPETKSSAFVLELVSDYQNVSFDTLNNPMHQQRRKSI